MLVGYMRVSKEEQKLDRQVDALIEAGVDKRNIYEEKITGTIKGRPALEKMLEELQEGDTVIVSELTRLSRGTKDLFFIVEQIEAKHATIKSLKESWLDTTTPTGRLMFTFIAGISQFERDLISQRTKEGLAAARARGRKGGRRKLMDDKKLAMAKKLYEDKSNSIDDICEMLKVSRTTFFRYLREEKAKNKESLPTAN